MTSAAAACDKVAEPPPAAMFGFRLAAHGDLPELLVAVEVVPPVSERDAVQPVSQLVADALGRCGPESAADTFAGTTTVGLVLESGRAVVGTTGGTALEACLGRALAGTPTPAALRSAQQIAFQIARPPR